MAPFILRAVNTAADAENRIHDDRVAAEFGFRGGLVPGVTVYGYMAAPVIEYFGPAWLERGAMDVRFHRPIYHDDEVRVTLHPENDSHPESDLHPEHDKRVRVEIGTCASALAWLDHDRAPPSAPAIANLGDRKIPSSETLAAGAVLGTLNFGLDLAAATISAPLDPMTHGVAQPAVLLALANRIFTENYQLGPWIHVASEVRKFHTVRHGDQLLVFGSIENRWERKGHEFVTLDVDIFGPNGPVEHIRQTAIWQPKAARS